MNTRGPASERAVLKMLSQKAGKVTPADVLIDQRATTADDFDDWFKQALVDRIQGRIASSGSTVEHPTARLLNIGIDSIRAGKPSDMFLRLLELVAAEAEDRDVMNLVFPTEVKIVKRVSLIAARREATIVAQFRNHLAKSIVKSTYTSNGREGLDHKVTLKRHGYAEATASFKHGKSDAEQKHIDRALRNRWPELQQWMAKLKQTP